MEQEKDGVFVFFFSFFETWNRAHGRSKMAAGKTQCRANTQTEKKINACFFFFFLHKLLATTGSGMN